MKNKNIENTVLVETFFTELLIKCDFFVIIALVE